MAELVSETGFSSLQPEGLANPEGLALPQGELCVFVRVYVCVCFVFLRNCSVLPVPPSRFFIIISLHMFTYTRM